MAEIQKEPAQNPNSTLPPGQLATLAHLHQAEQPSLRLRPFSQLIRLKPAICPKSEVSRDEARYQDVALQARYNDTYAILCLYSMII